jgi:flagellin
VGANPNQVINIGLKDFSYNLGVPAVASESKTSFSFSGLSSLNFVIAQDPVNNAATYSSGAKTQFDVTLSKSMSAATMTEDDWVELENKLTKAITDTAGYSNVSVTRVGKDIYVKDSEGRAISGFGTLSGTAFTAAASGFTDSITNGTVAVAGIDPATANAKSVFSGSARLNDTQIKTQTGANQAIARLDNAMANVDHELATFGSVMNRLTFAGDNLTNVSQNTQQSRSRVLDTDYAAATTELARTQIIQQAGMAMLAQANQQPQTVLSLLQ